jgi:hypothetical protein
MKKQALILSAGLALLTASVADAQESVHLAADYLEQATSLIHWPQGLEPRNADVLVRNEGWIDAPSGIVWTNLIDAAQWPSWYSKLGRHSHRGRPIQARQGCELQLEDVRFSHPKHGGCLRAGPGNRLERR